MMHASSPDFGPLTVNPRWKIAVIRSVWHGELTQALVTGAVETLIKRGLPTANVTQIDVPGTYELPLFAKLALEKDFDGVIVFGIVVEGETHHADLIAKGAARGCMDVQMKTGKPVTFEILHVETLEDAQARAIGTRSLGPVAAATLLTSLAKKAEMLR